jgi:hypothetical protein
MQAGSKERAPLFLVLNQNWNPLLPLGTSNNHKKKRLEMRKLWPPKVNGSRTQKNKPLNTTKAGSQTSKEFFVYCSVAIREQTYDL